MAVGAGAARAGEAEQASEMGAPGVPGRGVGTSPPVVDSRSEASSDGEAKGHADHRCKPGRSPRRLVKKGRWDGVVVALGEL